MKRKLWAAGVLAVLFGLWSGSPSLADTITDTTNNTKYTLTVPTDAAGVPIAESPGEGPAGTFTYDVTLTVDASGYNVAGTGTISLDAVAIKINANLDTAISAPPLDSAPGGAANWNVVYGGTNNSGGSSGCDPNTSNSFICAGAASAAFATANTPVGSAGDVYTFIFDVVLTSALTASDIGIGPSVKAIYCDQGTTGPSCLNTLTFNSQTSIDVPLQSPVGGQTTGGETLGGTTQGGEQVAAPTSLALLSTSIIGLALGGKFFRRRSRN